MDPLQRNSIFRFGTYEVSLQSGEVRKAGLRIRVQQQPMKLLELLLERPGEVVTREELRSQIWTNESFGDFDQAVNIAIAKLRSALGDSAENPRYIETLPKRGYRFIAEVTVVDTDLPTKSPESTDGDRRGREPEHQLDDAELAVTSKPRLWPTRRVIVVLAPGSELANPCSLVISFARPSAHRDPIIGGASAGQPLWRSNSGLFC